MMMNLKRKRRPHGKYWANDLVLIEINHMKQIAIFTVLILAGIILFNSREKEIATSYFEEEGDGEMIGQETLKHL